MNRDAVIVVDIEATCWPKQPPSGEQSEIIEIGVCLFDVSTLEPTDCRSILVKPQRSKVSPFCTRLTTLTPEMVNSGVTFGEACAILRRDFESHERLWLSWGSYDRKMFEQQSASLVVEYPFSPHHLNLREVFAACMSLHRQIGMTRALEAAALSLEGTHHRGVDDARNIARLLRFLIQRSGMSVLAPYW